MVAAVGLVEGRQGTVRSNEVGNRAVDTYLREEPGFDAGQRRLALAQRIAVTVLRYEGEGALAEAALTEDAKEEDKPARLQKGWVHITQLGGNRWRERMKWWVRKSNLCIRRSLTTWGS